MITKSELQALHQEMMVEDRRNLGNPPTVEEMLAYTRGELSAAEESRVRNLLVCYPELLRALTEAFPSDDAKPGDPGFLSEEELAKHWASLQARIHGPKAVVAHPAEARVLQFWRWTSAALAAALVLAFGGLLWQALSNARLAKELAAPRVASEEQVLSPDGRRGGGDGSATLSTEGDSFLLDVSLVNGGQFEQYRLEIVDLSATPPRSLWRSTALQSRSDDAFAILVPRAFLNPGRYQVVLYGVSRAREERLASYTMRVPAR